MLEYGSMQRALANESCLLVINTPLIRDAPATPREHPSLGWGWVVLPSPGPSPGLQAGPHHRAPDKGRNAVSMPRAAPRPIRPQAGGLGSMKPRGEKDTVQWSLVAALEIGVPKHLQTHESPLSSCISGIPRLTIFRSHNRNVGDETVRCWSLHRPCADLEHLALLMTLTGAQALSPWMARSALMHFAMA